MNLTADQMQSGHSRSKARIVMLHPGRCGSTVLADMLNQHKDIHWDGELFVGPAARCLTRVTLLPHYRWCSSSFFPHHPYEFIESQAAGATNSHYGFEMTLFDIVNNGLDISDFVAKLKARHFDYVIVVRRTNYLRQLISIAVALQNSRWHRKASSTGDLVRLTLDPDAVTLEPPPDERLEHRLISWLLVWKRCLLQMKVDHSRGPLKFFQTLRNMKLPDSTYSLVSFFEQQDRSFEQLERALNDHHVLQIKYEDHIETDPTVAYRMVCNFLGISEEIVSVRFAKTNPYSLKAMLINFDQVAHALANTKYAWMLNECL